MSGSIKRPRKLTGFITTFTLDEIVILERWGLFESTEQKKTRVLREAIRKVRANEKHYD